MKCEICHENDARTAIHVMVDGREKELYVCRECAERESEKGRRRQNRHRSDRPAFDGWDESDLPFPFDEDAEDNESRHDNRHWTLVEDIAPCPECGTTAEDIDHTSQLGCPYCYTAFKDLLSRNVRIGGAFAGKIPRRRGGASDKSASASDSRGK